MKADIKNVLDKQRDLDNALSSLCNRVTSIDKEVSVVTEVKRDLNDLQNVASEQRAETCALLARIDDLENRSRRSNLLFYGVPDVDGETPQISEQKVLDLARDSLGIAVDNSHVERAHRLGAFRRGKTRPIIVKFSSFKIKTQLLFSGSRLKGTPFSISEDFSLTVRAARKALLTFAKQQNSQFKLRFDKLFIGSKTYIYDQHSNLVKELRR